jgi:hypothetical protein
MLRQSPVGKSIQTQSEGSFVVLDGTASHNSDAAPLTSTWRSSWRCAPKDASAKSAFTLSPRQEILAQSDDFCPTS